MAIPGAKSEDERYIKCVFILERGEGGGGGGGHALIGLVVVLIDGSEAQNIL